jgi:LysM repeat protein
VNYIVARTGDTYLEIAKEFGMGLWQLYKYNNYSSIKDHLSEGDIVYLQPKRKYSRTVKQVVLSENKTLAEISQEEAVKIESLIQMNKSISSENQVLPKGSKVTLH